MGDLNGANGANETYADDHVNIANNQSNSEEEEEALLEENELVSFFLNFKIDIHIFGFVKFEFIFKL
jgi:hypothetical protein